MHDSVDDVNYKLHEAAHRVQVHMYMYQVQNMYCTCTLYNSVIDYTVQVCSSSYTIQVYTTICCPIIVSTLVKIYRYMHVQLEQISKLTAA